MQSRLIKFTFNSQSFPLMSYRMKGMKNILFQKNLLSVSGLTFLDNFWVARVRSMGAWPVGEFDQEK